jgi:GTPase SAR1 family protein
MDTFLGLFEKIEHISAEEDYDQFCKINMDNEKRKALSAFFVNLSITKIIPEETIVEFASNLLKQVLQFIHQDNKKNEVDEMVENIAILYNKDLFLTSGVSMPNGETFTQTIEGLAKSKSKNFASLSNKSIFKFMDMVEM